MAVETLESGALLPVLRAASHADLVEIVGALNKGLDVFITWDQTYKANQHDLTRIPNLIADYIRRAGGHAVSNFRHGEGPPYSEIVRGVCGALKIKITEGDNDTVNHEALLLQELLARALKNLSPVERHDLENRVKKMGVKHLRLEDIATSGAQLALFLPIILTIIGEQMAIRAATVTAEAIFTRIGASFLGPIGLVVGGVWLASDIAGPSYRATIPTVACIAMLRQRMIWGPRQ